MKSPALPKPVAVRVPPHALVEGEHVAGAAEVVVCAHRAAVTNARDRLIARIAMGIVNDASPAAALRCHSKHDAVLRRLPVVVKLPFR